MLWWKIFIGVVKSKRKRNGLEELLNEPYRWKRNVEVRIEIFKNFNYKPIKNQNLYFTEMHEPPYYTNYSKSRLFVHNVVTSKYFDLAIAAVIGLNVVTMAMEFYMMPKALTYALKIFNYFFTAVFILESFMKLLALGLHLYLKDKYEN